MEEEDAVTCKGDAENVMEVNDTSDPNFHKSDTTADAFSLKNEKENEKANIPEIKTTTQSENSVLSLPLSPAVTNTSVFHTQSSASSDRAKSLWTVKSPLPVKPCSNTFAIRRKSHENYSTKHFEERLPHNKSNNSLGSNLGLSEGSPSAFMRKGGLLPPTFMDIEMDGNILKRCNSAPILNDPE